MKKLSEYFHKAQSIYGIEKGESELRSILAQSDTSPALYNQGKMLVGIAGIAVVALIVSFWKLGEFDSRENEQDAFSSYYVADTLLPGEEFVINMPSEEAEHKPLAVSRPKRKSIAMEESTTQLLPPPPEPQTGKQKNSPSSHVAVNKAESFPTLTVPVGDMYSVLGTEYSILSDKRGVSFTFELSDSDGLRLHITSEGRISYTYRTLSKDAVSINQRASLPKLITDEKGRIVATISLPPRQELRSFILKKRREVLSVDALSASIAEYIAQNSSSESIEAGSLIPISAEEEFAHRRLIVWYSPNSKVKKLAESFATPWQSSWDESLQISSSTSPIKEAKVVPNPLSTNAEVVFTLHTPAKLTFTLHTFNGELLRELAPASHFDKGTHKLPLQFSDVVQGVYLLVAQSDDGTLQSIVTRISR